MVLADSTGRTMRRQEKHTDQIIIDGRSVPVLIRLNPRARKLIVQLDQKGDIVVVSPSRRSIPRAMQFANEHKEWLSQQLAQLASAVPFADGAIIPIQDIDHVIKHIPNGRRGVWQDTTNNLGSLPQLCVSGDAAFVQRRVTDWLRKSAKAELSQSCLTYANTLSLGPAKITVRDSKTRWGSCSSTGTLSFSWRLIFAPHFVLDYVAAHETAHRKYMSHGKRFWQLVDRLTPRRHEAEDWLNTKGNDLHRIGLQVGVDQSENNR